MKRFFLTTPIYYVNDVPHIGHAYTTIAADVLARWHRLNGNRVHFLTGTDEHGQKIMEAAAKLNLDTQAYVTDIAGKFRDLWKALAIANNDFIQTTDPRHTAVVQDLFEYLKESGDIYKGTYEDWYCLNDESYYSESELVDKKCPSCGRDVQKLKEESYFFRLSKYQQSLLDHYEKNPEFLSPAHRASEIVNFVKSGLRDLSVSRSRVKWGVPILSDPGHTVYVWFDALINYISALGFKAKGSPGPEFTEFWPADVHLVGKEIFRFHTVIWPAMLMALKLALPKKVFAHGWWTVEGTKMSKSLGNVVDPHAMAAEYGVDAFRYFLLREVPFGADGDFSEKALLGRYNSELANNLGNLVQRTTTILHKQFEGRLPAPSRSFQLLSDLPALVEKIDRSYDHLAFGEVLESLHGLMIKTNKFIDEQAPWTLGADRKEDLGNILVECLRVVKVLTVFYAPFMPEKMAALWARLGETGPFEQSAADLIARWRGGEQPRFGEGQTAIKGDPLFMRKGGRWK